jgi:hypothetical protein
MKDKIVFDSIQDIKHHQRKMRPQKLDKLDDHDFSQDREIVGSQEFELATRNDDSLKRTLPSIMKRQEDPSRSIKQGNLRYNNVDNNDYYTDNNHRETKR